MIDQLVRRYAGFYTDLTPASLDEADALFRADARFRDPFNDVVGVEAIKAIFVHMFDSLDEPSFEILEFAGTGKLGFFHWRFHYRSQGEVRSFEGMSRVEFDADGLVRQHTDYWDPTNPVYREVPLLGYALEQVRRRLAAKPATV